jgi:CheY-like chemotaxis protein
VDLNRIIAGAIEDVRDMAHLKGVSFIAELSPTALWLSGDPVRLTQVFINLFTNGVKYTGTGGTVSVYSIPHGKHAEIEIRDNGIGIEPQSSKELFQPFRRGRAAAVTSESGLGLGLAIVKQIIQAHRGSVWAESKGLGSGSVFHVRLPLMIPRPNPIRLTAVPHEPPREAEPVRILLIEDAEDVLWLMKLELEAMGHTVVTAANSIQAIEMVQRELPDLIISDIKMPGVDGFQLIKTIRATREVSTIPAIALTGFSRKKDVDKAIAAGFDSYIAKPAEPKKLGAVIQQLTEKRRA